MFGTSWFHPQGDSGVYNMVCCTRILSTRLLSPMHVKHTYCIYNCLPEDELTRVETCRRHQKLSIKY